MNFVAVCILKQNIYLYVQTCQFSMCYFDSTYSEGSQNLRNASHSPMQIVDLSGGGGEDNSGITKHVDHSIIEDEDPNEENDTVNNEAFSLRGGAGSVMYQPFSSSNNIAALGKKSKSDEPATLVRARTSSQLIDMAKDSVDDDQRKIADFIKLIKSGEVQTTGTSNFRQRRLTYSAKTDDEVPSVPSSVAASPEVMHKVMASVANGTISATDATIAAAATPFSLQEPATTPSIPDKAALPIAPSPSPTRKSTIRNVRTTIFASSEIGTITEKAPPFPDNVLGTYSCHGIEPSDDEEDGIHQKINQDRACVVYPYNSKKNEALFMVLDGHGGEGDKVSEFVMRQVS
jgi:hypothetical protein